MDFQHVIGEPGFRVVDPAPADDGSVVLTAAGELDRDTAGLLLAALERVWRSGVRTGVNLDLGDMTFIDAAGARTLLACRSAAADHGLDLTVSNLRPPVRRVLGILGILEVFEP